MDAARPGCLRITPPAGVDADLVADRCWLLGATAVGDSGGDLEVGFPTDAHAETAAVALGEWWPAAVVEVVDPGPALAAALEAWRPFARPLRVPPLHIRPAWLAPDDDPPAAGERSVLVDPTHAFGYDHPSTVACLEAVARLAGTGTAVLDVGCGSGVLAVAAAVLGAGPVVAVDVDPVAVDATRRAAQAAGVAVEASTTPVGELAGAFDLVLANIGAATLTGLAPAIASRVAMGGTLVLAGLLATQAGAVAAAYEQEGLSLVEITARDGWASPEFLRKSTISRD
jgi:ribosomal protein L11 methyltransferase